VGFVLRDRIMSEIGKSMSGPTVKTNTCIEIMKMKIVKNFAGYLMYFLVFGGAAAWAADIIPADRRIDWAAGIPGGIPNSTSWTVINVKNSPYNAVGDGVHDDTSNIQSAINAAGPNTVVYIPSGTYRVTAALTINYNNPKHHVVIRGNGPSNTKLKYTGTGARGIINVQNVEAGWADNLTGGYTKGSTSLTVTDSTRYNIGDFILIDQLNDPTFVDLGGEYYHSRAGGNRVMGQIVKVTAKSGNNVTINRPLYFTFKGSQTPQAYGDYDRNTLSSYIGVENLYLETASSDLDVNGISFIRGIYCWAKNVEVNKTGQFHVHLWLAHGCEVRDSYLHHGNSYDSGHAYGVMIESQSTDNLVENNIIYYVRHGVSIESGGTGNVIGYNYVDRLFDYYYPNTDFLMQGIMTHGAHPYMNLVEGNMASSFAHDNVHGSSSHNTTFRNAFTASSQGEAKSVIYSPYAVAICNKNYYENVVGNIFNKPGQVGSFETSDYPCSLLLTVGFRNGWVGSVDCGAPTDSKVNATAIRHMNYCYLDQQNHLDSSISISTLPSSYYLSAKPGWWGTQPWPSIGPDVPGHVNDIPAKLRFNQIQNPTLPAPPTNLRITSTQP
jgi:hypothetical protein